MREATIVFTTHRPEMIPLASGLMERHEAVFLEEPPEPGFSGMLARRLSIDEYLRPIDVEYPEFSRSMCRQERRLYDRGIAIMQVEPFLEELMAIHELFANGCGPEDIKRQTLRHAVYVREKNATGALLSYYRTVITKSFDESVSAILAFARQDAARFRLRDKLRAIAIANRMEPYQNACIEAGVIHYGLYPMLKKQLNEKIPVKPVFPARQAIARTGGKGHLYGPGDQLTLLFILHPRAAGFGQRETLLAARSLVYAKLIAKEEISGDPDTFPHIRNELETIALVSSLSIADCRRLFPEIRRRPTAEAVEIVRNYQAART
ncbi:MAG: hypothetical protein R6X08_04495 [Desulfosalsimonadaceae bacterium]